MTKLDDMIPLPTNPDDIVWGKTYYVELPHPISKEKGEEFLKSIRPTENS